MSITIALIEEMLGISRWKKRRKLEKRGRVQRNMGRMPGIAKA